MGLSFSLLTYSIRRQNPDAGNMGWKETRTQSVWLLAQFSPLHTLPVTCWFLRLGETVVITEPPQWSVP